MSLKVLVPDSAPVELTMPDGATAVTYAIAKRIPAEHRDAEVLVLWGNSAERLAEAAADLPNLRLVQTLAAGPDAALAAGFTPSAAIASGRGLHDGPVAEHTLALALAAARRIPDLVRAHDEHVWRGDLGGLQPVSTEGTFRTLRDARVTVWGFGSIASALAPLLTALGAQVTGVANTAGERGGYPVIAGDDIDALLPETDLLIMVLPALPETDHILGVERLALLPNHAWVINVGRGNAIDEAGLIAALESGTIGGACLDVTSVEPLPADNPLWSAPNLFITPHAAGGRPLGSAELVAANIRAVLKGAPVRNRVR